MSSSAQTFNHPAIEQLAVALGVGVAIGVFILIIGIITYENGIKPWWNKRCAAKKAATAGQDAELTKIPSEGGSELSGPSASRPGSNDGVTMPGVPERTYMVRCDSGRLVMSGALY